MTRHKVLINMANIHSGGGLQVAISFISELLKFECKKFVYKILISTDVASAFEPDVLKMSAWDFEVLDTYGINALWSKLNKKQCNYDIVFTLFGPKYTVFKAKIDIVGFAQPWILSFDNPISMQMPLIEKLYIKLKYDIQKWFFKRADHLVVELEHVHQALVEKGIFPKESLSVVHNTLSNHYLHEEHWQPIALSIPEKQISIGFITRDYSHKNIKILSKVAILLNEKYSLPVKFYFSLNAMEWRNHSQSFGNYGITVGALSVFQCPMFYKKMDAVVFPSILECFSVTPLEALAMRKPLFASDRGFVRNVCGEHAYYFDPLDPEDIASVIAGYFNGRQKTDAEIDSAHDHVIAFSNAEQRAKKYLEIIEQYLKR
jgi:glycosyltransferase involved in cell wall biosynthesis